MKHNRELGSLYRAGVAALLQTLCENTRRFYSWYRLNPINSFKRVDSFQLIDFQPTPPTSCPPTPFYLKSIQYLNIGKSTREIKLLY